MSNTAGDPTYFQPNTGWTVQSNTGSGTGPANSGTVIGSLGATTDPAVTQAAVGGASGPMSATYADPSESGAVSETWEKTLLLGNIKPSHPTDAIQGVY